MGLQTINKTREVLQMSTENSLAHTKWECKYHIVFAPKYSVSVIMVYLKGKRSLMIFEKHVNLKYKYDNPHLWFCGYYVDTAGKNTDAIKKYIQNQLKEDLPPAVSSNLCLIIHGYRRGNNRYMRAYRNSCFSGLKIRHSRLCWRMFHHFP